ncbi:hypothetical protein [Rhizobium leguminosarum]|uniref:hypothetical protein n=1 Tax=Rhizobium leguminosarum TaxID=384 RepID=UPI001C9020B3|nr:hypothetical protein [Rhizobium leguminosarum]MBY2937185.1 hypothetical protein [Rhizobium leguminosarum]
MSTSALKANVAALVLIGVMLAFFQFWGTFMVPLVASAFFLAFIWRMYYMSREFALNRVAFGSQPDVLLTPDLKPRQAVGLFRAFSEHGEDRLMFAITSGLVANPWWLAISALLYSFSSIHLTRRSWPGFTLAFGKSGSEEFNILLRPVMRSTRPFNTTTMINFPDPGEREEGLTDVLGDRIRNLIVSWGAVIEAHASLAKIIVVSLHELGPTVTEELKLIDERRLWFKTIVFSNRPTEETLHLPLRAEPSRAGALVTSDLGLVRDTIRAMARGELPVPTVDAPISSRARRHDPAA